MEVRNVVSLVDTYKAKAAFLVPVLVAAGAAVASWVVTGDFNDAEIRTAVGGAITSGIAAVAAYVAPAGRAKVE
jgi:hypothetical protein